MCYLCKILQIQKIFVTGSNKLEKYKKEQLKDFYIIINNN